MEAEPQRIPENLFVGQIVVCSYSLYGEEPLTKAAVVKENQRHEKYLAFGNGGGIHLESTVEIRTDLSEEELKRAEADIEWEKANPNSWARSMQKLFEEMLNK